MKKKPTPTPKKRPAKKTVRLSRPLVSERTETLVDEMVESVRQLSKSIDASNAKADKILAGWEKDRKELRDEQEGLKRTFARMAEGAFRHNFAELMARFDIPLREDDILVRVQKDNNSGEYDLVGVNCDTTVITEVKSRFTAKHITELRGKLARFRLEHPELVRKRLVGVAAGLSVNPDAADLARKFGFIVLQLNGAAIASKTPANFTPASY